jgi:hypothetical protein
MNESPIATSGPASSQMRLMMRCLVGLLCAQALAGCGGGGTSTPPAANVVPTTNSVPPIARAAEPWQGHFIGTVKMGAGRYYGDAILTVDGAVRLYVGGPYASDGTVQKTRADGAAQFVGKVQGNANRASGSGIMIGLNCAAPSVLGRFCGASAQAKININSGASDGQLQGEVHVTTNAGDEIWSLDLFALDNYYLLPAAQADVAGVYQETLAEIAGDGVTTVGVDNVGRLFFQSAYSGCVGNGTVTPHLDGKFNVYDVTLTIESCQAGYAYLNGAFDGLATTSPSSIWDYDSLLRVWLSKAEGAPSQAALVMLSQ